MKAYAKAGGKSEAAVHVKADSATKAKADVKSGYESGCDNIHENRSKYGSTLKNSCKTGSGYGCGIGIGCENWCGSGNRCGM